MGQRRRRGFASKPCHRADSAGSQPRAVPAPIPPAIGAAVTVRMAPGHSAGRSEREQRLHRGPAGDKRDDLGAARVERIVGVSQ